MCLPMRYDYWRSIEGTHSQEPLPKRCTGFFWLSLEVTSLKISRLNMNYEECCLDFLVMLSAFQIMQISIRKLIVPYRDLVHWCEFRGNSILIHVQFNDISSS